MSELQRATQSRDPRLRSIRIISLYRNCRDSQCSKLVFKTTCSRDFDGFSTGVFVIRFHSWVPQLTLKIVSNNSDAGEPDLCCGTSPRSRDSRSIVLLPACGLQSLVSGSYCWRHNIWFWGGRETLQLGPCQWDVDCSYGLIRILLNLEEADAFSLYPEVKNYNEYNWFRELQIS